MLTQVWSFTPCPLGHKAICKLTTIQQRSVINKLGLFSLKQVCSWLLPYQTNSMAKYHMIIHPFRILENKQEYYY